MAEFFGMLKGSRGSTTRLGTRTTGISSDLCSWHGKIVTQLYYNKDTLMVRVWLDRHEGHGLTKLLIEQSLSNLQDGKLPLIEE